MRRDPGVWPRSWTHGGTRQIGAQHGSLQAPAACFPAPESPPSPLLAGAGPRARGRRVLAPTPDHAGVKRRATRRHEHAAQRGGGCRTVVGSGPKEILGQRNGEGGKMPDSPRHTAVPLTLLPAVWISPLPTAVSARLEPSMHTSSRGPQPRLLTPPGPVWRRVQVRVRGEHRPGLPARRSGARGIGNRAQPGSRQAGGRGRVSVCRDGGERVGPHDPAADWDMGAHEAGPVPASQLRRLRRPPAMPRCMRSARTPAARQSGSCAPGSISHPSPSAVSRLLQTSGWSGGRLAIVPARLGGAPTARRAVHDSEGSHAPGRRRPPPCEPHRLHGEADLWSADHQQAVRGHGGAQPGGSGGGGIVSPGLRGWRVRRHHQAHARAPTSHDVLRCANPPPAPRVDGVAGVMAENMQRLGERGEKLSRLEDRTAELEDDAGNFASLAKQLADGYSNRKWWQM